MSKEEFLKATLELTKTEPHNTVHLSKENEQIAEIIKIIESCSFAEIEQIILHYCDVLFQQKEFIKYLEDEIYSIEPKGTGINFNCEYDSEEDYVMAMQEQSRLNTLKENLQKYKGIIGDDKQ